jgi:hypothetical protein
VRTNGFGIARADKMRNLTRIHSVAPSGHPMPLFWKPYKSDVTQFIDSLKQRDPQLEERQRQGRLLLWDKALDRQTQKEFRDGNVAQQPYVYQTKG